MTRSNSTTLAPLTPLASPVAFASTSVRQQQQVVSVLVVDDDRHFRQGLRTLLDFYSNNGAFTFRMVGETASIDQTRKSVQEQRPMLILLNTELQNGEGIAILAALQEMHYKGKVLALSNHWQDEQVFRVMEAGAKGYILKSYLATELWTAINTMLKDQVYLSPEVATSFFRLFHFYSGRSLATRQQLHLTEREQEVLQWLVQGASNELIAEKLYITVATVKAHLTGIFQKLSVTSRTQAIVKALKLGLVS